MATFARVAGLGVNACAKLIIIPLALKAMGVERYGLWVAAVAAFSWIGLADIGLTPGLTNLVSASFGANDPAALRRHISTAFVLTGLLATVLLAVAGVLLFCGPLDAAMGHTALKSIPKAEARAVLAAVSLLTILSFLLSYVNPVCAGLQEGYLQPLGGIVSNVLTVLFVACLSQTGGTLLSFSVAMGLPQVLGALALTLYVFGYRHRQLMPAIGLCARDSLTRLCGISAWAFLIQVAEFAVMQLPSVLIVSRFGGVSMGLYATCFAVFNVIAQVTGSVAFPLWPAYAEALAKGDVTWIRKSIRRCHGICVSVALCGVTALLCFGARAIAFWTNGAVRPSSTLLACLGLYFLLTSVSVGNHVLFLGLGLLRARAVICAVYATVILGAFGPLATRYGVEAMPMAGALGLLVDLAISPFIAGRFLRRFEAGSGREK